MRKRIRGGGEDNHAFGFKRRFYREKVAGREPYRVADIFLRRKGSNTTLSTAASWPG